MSDIIGNNEKLLIIPCNNCKNYNNHDMESFSCKAFKNIPKVILNGENNHKKPLSWQENNIVYESKD